jgi:hypothetical protein
VLEARAEVGTELLRLEGRATLPRQLALDVGEC